MNENDGENFTEVSLLINKTRCIQCAFFKVLFLPIRSQMWLIVSCPSIYQKAAKKRDVEVIFLYVLDKTIHDSIHLVNYSQIYRCNF